MPMRISRERNESYVFAFFTKESDVNANGNIVSEAN
jgi:hypothetical protein